jgi:hypothetical protein
MEKEPYRPPAMISKSNFEKTGAKKAGGTPHPISTSC